MTLHSSILAGIILWTEEPDGNNNFTIGVHRVAMSQIGLKQLSMHTALSNGLI